MRALTRICALRLRKLGADFGRDLQAIASRRQRHLVETFAVGLINPALLASGLPDMPYADEMTQVFDYVTTPPAAPAPTAEAPYRLFLALRAAEQMSKNAEAYSKQVADIFGTIFGLFIDLDDFTKEVNDRALSTASGQLPALTDSFKKLRGQLVSSRNQFIGYFRSKFDLTAVQGKRAFNALSTLIT